ncbi:uncharacterized protein LOC127799289 [Diospyros lotus]|uniref:uncharacterized protein LOC127799289 n=1 Tax=Diospyros lotus TaxID=55363 RepID=UPI00225102B9|nr:uncharacterized protein LOC127799289 [Diospyros lotus]
MELELGLKIIRTSDDFSSADLRIAKDRSGPLFVSRESDAMFILTAYLKGYRREWIKIEINEDGSRIVISGEKPVQEMVMVGWMMYKKEMEMRGFKKGFKIPDGVILDDIKARFDEEESTLTVSMPKLVKGIRGEGVEEEVIENEAAENNVEEVAGEKVHDSKDEEVEEESEAELEERECGQEKEMPSSPPLVEKAQVVEDHDIADQIDASRHEQERQQLQGKDETQKERRNGDQASQPRERISKKFRVPIVAGSAILVSVIVFVIHLIRTKNPPSKRRN